MTRRLNCAHCIYWVADTTATPAPVGHCHRLPPGVAFNSKTATLVQRFPITGRNEWCGEWQGDDSQLRAAEHTVTRAIARRPTRACEEA